MPRKPPDSWRYHARTAARRYPGLKEAEAALHSVRVTANLEAPRHIIGTPTRGTEAAALRNLPEADRRQIAAVERALAITDTLPNGRERRKLVRLIFFENRFTLEGAAQQIPASTQTAQRWSDDFLLLVWATLWRSSGAPPGSAQDRTGAPAASPGR